MSFLLLEGFFSLKTSACMESACVNMAEGSQCQSSGLMVAIEGNDSVLHS